MYTVLPPCMIVTMTNKCFCLTPFWCMQVHMKLVIYQKVYMKKYTVYHLLLYILFGVENVYEVNALLDTSF